MNSQTDMLMEMKHKCVSAKYIPLEKSELVDLWEKFGEWLKQHQYDNMQDLNINNLEKSVFWDIIWLIAKSYNYTKNNQNF